MRLWHITAPGPASAANASLCPLEVFREEIIRKKPGHPLSIVSTSLRIQVEFLTETESKEWFERGLRLEDLLSLPGRADRFEHYNFRCHGDDQPDLKIILVHNNGQLDGIFWYDKARIDHERVQKYVERYLSVMENIEYGGHKTTVSSLIGRFYQKIWASQ